MYLNEQLIHIGQSLAGIVPELFLALFLLIYLIAELLLHRYVNKDIMGRILFITTLAGAVLALGFVLGQWGETPGFRFHSMLFLDNIAVFFKLLVIGAWIFTLLHIRIVDYDFPTELNALLIAATLGLCLLCMATHWLSVYIALELVSVSSYLLVALSPSKKAAEGSLKYLLFGAISSAIMLYGISLIYGLTGTLDFTDPAMRFELARKVPFVMYTAIFMTFGGILFKLSLVPFHVWAPDVYEATPTPLVSFLSVAPKAAVLLVLMRAVSALPTELLPLLGGIALISIIIGNVAALWQQNARRLLAYSSIAQAGYLIIGIVAFTALGFESATFYMAAYLLLNMGAFLLIDLLRPRSQTILSEYAGLGKKHIWIASTLTLIMVALAGLPPTVGFTAKWLVFSALWDSYQAQGQPWLMWLLIVGIINAAISLAYYLRLPYLLFFKPALSQPIKPRFPVTVNIIVGTLLAAILLLFFKPEFLMVWIRTMSL
ncbi:NADH-quinone oxidoreductase subunit N [Cytophagaceae bacterium SJW1-29]|uniref:NADH-quinone oxidoreductase subunit N n=1 Tax=Salmonirosea aquatica TaxID=2654236 RepID=A0A7C9F6D5_9BACT|nr:NADH-quinone oxidoreductase subunit N [Cytophagaceae bacterium SJW1-29]